MKTLLLPLCLVLAACAGSSPGGGDDDDGVDGGGGPGSPDASSDAEGDDPIDFSNNLLPSPMPPGNLTPANAPQIIVFGWDDCAFTGDHAADLAVAPDNGMNFIASVFGDITNPDGSPGAVTFYENGAYLPNTEPGGPWGSETMFMQAAGQELIALGFELGNHTFDHLEINGTWGKIPPAYKMGSLGGWTEHVGTLMDQATWGDLVIPFNDQFLRATYGMSAASLSGFRAPRLEINDEGLKALIANGYLYDTNMEEGHQWEYVAAATRPEAAVDGFRWVVWPHTLDNGSPGVWQTQDFGEKHYLADFPRGLWEVPVYMVYVPDNGLQQTIATRMKTEITMEPTDWIGDRVREITAFDFNTFLYARLTKDEWVEVMKHTFLARYHGNRAPLTFGAHPAEFSVRYDNEVLAQPNNADFLDVLGYNRYSDRKAAVREFIAWVQANYPDVYFMSGKQLVEYMANPFDKDGNPVAPDTLATPTANDLFAKLPEWTVERDALGSDASYSVVDDNTMTIDFTVASPNEAAGEYPFVDVAAYFAEGTLANVSHIDIVYETDVPFRVRALPAEGSGLLGMQALLAGVGGERKARIRIKDLRPDPYAAPTALASANFVDAGYMARVAGLSFESAATKPGTYTVKIKRIVVHGLGEVSASARVAPPDHARARRHPPRAGSAAHWPRHREAY